MLVGWLVLFAALGILGRSALAGRAAVLVAPVALARLSSSAPSASTSPERSWWRSPRSHGGMSLLLALRPRRSRARRRRASCLRFSSSSRPGRRSTRWRRLARTPTAAAGSTGSRIRSRRSCSRRPSLLRRGRRRGRRGDRPPASRHGRLEPGRGGRRWLARRRSVVRRAPGRSRARPARRRADRRSGSPSCVAVGLAIVGLDALLGGSSHVTDAVGGGPGTLLDDLDRRLRISWAGATSAPHTAFLCLLSLGGLAWLGVRGRHEPSILAMLVAIGVSLLVNDTPVDVLGYGALGCLALTAWEETRDAVAAQRAQRASSRLPAPREHPAR